MTNSYGDSYYAEGDPDALRGTAVRRTQRRALTQHVPIRFSAESIERIQAFADADGMTVSSWVRRVIDDEVRRRSLRPQTGNAMEWHIINMQTAQESRTSAGLALQLASFQR